MHPILFEIGASRSTPTACCWPPRTCSACSSRWCAPGRAGSTPTGSWTSASGSSSARSSARSCCCWSSTSTPTAAIPRELLTLVRSGGVFYGGLIAAVAVALWYLRRHRCRCGRCGRRSRPASRSATSSAGSAACSPAAASASRRRVPWAITFHSDYAARNVGTPLSMPLHPTQLYEAGAELLILGLLLATERRGRPFPGRTFWGYMLLYGISRFIIEFYRGDARGMRRHAVDVAVRVAAHRAAQHRDAALPLGRREGRPRRAATAAAPRA